MKHLLFISLLFMCSHHAFCYDQQQLVRYYTYIYQAEKNVIDEDYKAASGNYDKAFVCGVTPFAAHIYNNMLVGLKQSDNQRVLKIADMFLNSSWKSNSYNASKDSKAA